jgi:hypothetical protein
LRVLFGNLITADQYSSQLTGDFFQRFDSGHGIPEQSTGGVERMVNPLNLKTTVESLLIGTLRRFKAACSKQAERAYKYPKHFNRL